MLHLSQNLRLADNHRVQACCYTKQVADDIAVGVLVQIVADCGHIREQVFTEKAAQVGAIIGAGDKFYAVACREDDAFGYAVRFEQPSSCFFETPLRYRKPLAHFDRSGLVIHPNEMELHRDTNLWTPLK